MKHKLVSAVFFFASISFAMKEDITSSIGEDGIIVIKVGSDTSLQFLSVDSVEYQRIIDYISCPKPTEPPRKKEYPQVEAIKGALWQGGKRVAFCFVGVASLAYFLNQDFDTSLSLASLITAYFTGLEGAVKTHRAEESSTLHVGVLAYTAAVNIIAPLFSRGDVGARLLTPVATLMNFANRYKYDFLEHARRINEDILKQRSKLARKKRFLVSNRILLRKFSEAMCICHSTFQEIEDEKIKIAQLHPCHHVLCEQCLTECERMLSKKCHLCKVTYTGVLFFDSTKAEDEMVKEK